MTGFEYLEGAAFFGVMLLGTGSAAMLCAREQTHLPAAVRASQLGVLWLAAIFVVHLVPGMLGLLDRWAVALASVVLAGVAYAATRRLGPAPVTSGYPVSPPSGPWSWAFAIVAAGATAVVVLAMGLADAGTAPFHVDVVSFHLPNVARWIQSGNVWQLDDFIPDRSPGAYPQTGDIYSLATMLPWRSDFLVRFVNYPLLLLAATSTYALTRELRAPAATAVVTTSAFAAMPVVAWTAFAGLTDIAMLATFGCGCLFLARHARTGAPADLILAGVGLGLAFGTRWYAVPAVAIVVVAWLVARAASSERRAVLSALAGLAGLITAFGGFWLLRNWVQTGNPVYPVKVAALGVTIFDAPRDAYRALEGFSIADYATRPSIWREYFFASFLRAMGGGAVLLWAGLAAAGLWAIALFGRRPRGGARESGVIAALALVGAAAAIGVVYTLTPYTAVGEPDQPVFAWVNSRYVVPALLLGVPATAWVVARVGRFRPWLELVLALGTLDGLRRVIDLQGPGLQARWAAVAVLAVGGAAVAGIAAQRLTWSREHRPAIAGLAVVAAAGLLALGAVQERSYAPDRYAAVDPVFTYVAASAPAGKKIGLVGEGWASYMFFGPRFGNDVEFVGSRVDGTYRNFRRRSSFERGLRRGRFDLVVFHDYASIDKKLPARQEGWLRSMGYKPVATGVNPFAFSRRATVYAPPERGGGA